VEDVSELCSRMAIIASGKIVATGKPSELTAALKGKVWKKIVAKADLDATRAKYTVILTRLVGGQTMIHIVSDTDPGDGFAPVDAGLEDVYFSTLDRNRRAA
jgi:ABC-type multidrug transport system ATPase subunit